MALVRGPEMARFLVGILASGPREARAGADALERAFGPAERGSRVFPFDNTGYYIDELGPRPLRAFLAFPGPFPTEELAARKLAANALERELALALGGPSPRPVNLDPGYVTGAKLVLASAKNFAHRVHLRDGIYAEVTLQYRHGSWRSFPWTFPDYASGRYDAFLCGLRESCIR